MPEGCLWHNLDLYLPITELFDICNVESSYHGICNPEPFISGFDVLKSRCWGPRNESGDIRYDEASFPQKMVLTISTPSIPQSFLPSKVMKPKKYTRSVTLKEAKEKAAKYCAYQERAQQEVRDKLYHMGLRSDEMEEVLTELIMENFINESRYADAYARGRFHLKKWGRIKIQQGLKEKGLSDRCIQEGLASIDEGEYQETLYQLAEKKWGQLKDDAFVKKQKVARFLMQKGYEGSLVWPLLSELEQSERRGKL